MKKNIWKNIVMNVILSIIFVALSQKALEMRLEETQVSLVMFFGVIMTIGNSIFVYRCKK
jgi:hypothetical protein